MSGSGGPGPRTAAALAIEFRSRGLDLDPVKQNYIQGRMIALGEGEWQRRKAVLEPFAVDELLAIRWLGAGYALTQFVTAPVMELLADRETVYSQGALINLMVVLCDRLLDSGTRVEDVLPPDELAGGGGSGSPVMAMLREFLMERASGPQSRFSNRPSNRRIISRMFEAEIATVRMGVSLPRKHWRRKCGLPLVLMGWPEMGHFGWLYRVGRFLGALDDAVDFEEDARTNQPNYWKERTVCPSTVGRWGKLALSYWDRTVPAATETVIYRESFLNMIWAWLV